jgi:hypothetical protein
VISRRVPRLLWPFLFFLAAGLPASAFSLAPPQQQPAPVQDSASLVRRAVQNELSAVQTHTPQRFTLHKVDDRHDTTREIIESKDGDVARLVAVGGKPLGPNAVQAEQDRLNFLKDHPELQDHRRKREQEDADRVNSLIRLLPDAFLYRDAGMVSCPAGQCRRLTFTPNPKFDSPTMESNILRGMAGEMWIDPAQQRITKIDSHLIDDVDFGWGMIGRLRKGGTVVIEQSEVSKDQWAVTRLKLDLTGRALLVKSLSIRMTEEESNFSPLPSPVGFRQAIQMLLSSPSATPEIAEARP